MTGALTKNVLLAVFAVAASCTAAFGQAAETKGIDVYVASIDAMVKAAKKPHLVFADTSDVVDGDSVPEWRRFASENALTRYREAESETYEIAFVWTKDGNPVASNFTLFSPSGDWAQYDNHYFRADGSIAKIISELRTFHGNFILKRQIWFDVKGVQIASSRNYSDLDSGKPIKRPKDAFETDVKRFRNVAGMPFFKLIPRSR